MKTGGFQGSPAWKLSPRAEEKEAAVDSGLAKRDVSSHRAGEWGTEPAAGEAGNTTEDRTGRVPVGVSTWGCRGGTAVAGRLNEHGKDKVGRHGNGECCCTRWLKKCLPERGS